MATNLREFRRALSGFADEVRRGHERNVRRIAAVGFEAIMRITPIDTSEARTNWRSSVGQPIASKAGFVPGQGGSTAGQAYAIAGREFAGALGQYRIGRRFFFRNNAGHIEDLEMPTVKSRQAPGGILGPTVQAIDMETGK